MKRKASGRIKTARGTKRQRANSYNASALKVDAVAYRALRSVHPDFKVTDTHNAGFAPNAPATIISLLENMSTGTGMKDEYVGRTITPVGLDVRLELIGSQTSTFVGADLFNNSRILVFQWMDDATVTEAGILQSVAEGLSPGFKTTSPINFSNYNNIEVLVDENFQTFINAFEPTTGSYATSDLHFMHRYIKGKKMREVEFDGSGANTTRKGGLFAMLLSDSTAAPNPSFNLYTRLTFLDV